MKNIIKVLSFLSFLAIIVFLFFSCAKEELTPVEQTDRVSPRMAYDVTVGQPDITADNIEKQMPEFNSLADALESVNFVEHPDWEVDIKAYKCRRVGETLIVYNPKVHQPNFYDSKRFVIYWFKNDRPIARNTNYKLECTCKGEYAAIVLNRFNQNAIGIAFYSVEGCPKVEDDSAPTKIN